MSRLPKVLPGLQGMTTTIAALALGLLFVSPAMAESPQSGAAKNVQQSDPDASRPALKKKPAPPTQSAPGWLTEQAAGAQTEVVGTVVWSEGRDPAGPTILAEVAVPERDLAVKLVIRRNDDASLPIDIIIELAFEGPSIKEVTGVLTKTERQAMGTPLQGASARIVGNDFLFAVSSAEDDLATSVRLLRERQWLDVAMTYDDGTRATLTLEKTEEVDELFRRALTQWASAAQ